MFEVYKDKGKKKNCWRWRLKDKEADIIAISEEAFIAKRNAERSIETIRKSLSSKTARFEIYMDKPMRARWKMVSKNGRTLAMSPIGFDSLTMLWGDLGEFKKLARKPKIKEV